MRGTALEFHPRACGERFIPAHAGNGWKASGARCRASVHPRACGERLGQVCDQFVFDGSSPRMRGTAGAVMSFDLPWRFIPAHAGNGSKNQSNACPPSVHPRACGERVPLLPPIANRGGSSPRMRGTECFERPRRCRGRFIPAHAGNGSWRRSSRPAAPVHPRACGERHVPTAIH